jgi:hypothetical protein
MSYAETADSFWFESNLGHRWFDPSKQERGADLRARAPDVLKMDFMYI